MDDGGRSPTIVAFQPAGRGGSIQASRWRETAERCGVRPTRHRENNNSMSTSMPLPLTTSPHPSRRTLRLMDNTSRTSARSRRSASLVSCRTARLRRDTETGVLHAAVVTACSRELRHGRALALVTNPLDRHALLRIE